MCQRLKSWSFLLFFFYIYMLLENYPFYCSHSEDFFLAVALQVCCLTVIKNKHYLNCLFQAADTAPAFSQLKCQRHPLWVSKLITNIVPSLLSTPFFPCELSEHSVSYRFTITFYVQLFQVNKMFASQNKLLLFKNWNLHSVPHVFISTQNTRVGTE